MSRPNIVFLFADDQRFNTIHALGNSHIRTPNLDSLVARGAAFTHAHIPGGTSGAVCMPSRAMLHTGRTLFHIAGAGESIPEEHVTLGEHLRGNGYRTFGTGKWHNGTASYARSFSDGGEIFFGGMEDHWNVPACDFDPTGSYARRVPKCRDPYGSKVQHAYVADHVTAGKHSSELFADAAIAFLEEYEDEAPFFAYVSFMAPHDPRVMPAEYRCLYRDEDIPLPESFMPEHPFDMGTREIRDELLASSPRGEDEVREHIADYCAMITHLDAQIGRVLDSLERKGFADNTIIVFAGDNGLAVGCHGLMGKQNLYEHSVRVPLVFAGPGIPQGVRTDALVYLLDIFPTLCELTGCDLPPSVEGQSLMPAMRDPGAGVRDALYLAYTGLMRGVRTGTHKLIRYNIGGNQRTQLFDIREDPDELHDLIGDPGAATVATRLREQFERLRDEWDDESTPWGRQFWGR